MIEHDVVVVGAGPAGLLFARLLAQAGRDVVVFERSAGADERSRAIGIHPPGLAALRAVGLEDAVRAEALALSGGVVTSGGRILADLGFAAERPVLTLPQQRIDALLDASFPGTTRRGARVIDAGQDEDAVHVDVEVCSDIERHRAALLVLADGVHSRLRDRCGFGWRRIPGGGDYLMADVPSEDRDDRARLHLERDGVVECFPLPGGMRRWVLREGDRAARTADAFRAEILRRSGIDIGPAEVAPTGFRARQHRATRLVRGRMVLLGDAAHEVSPIGGQGMNLAWIDACRLAVAVTRHRDRERALAAYEGATHRSAAIAQRRARFNMAMGAPWADLPRAARDAAIRIIGRGAAGERMLDAMTMRGL